MLKFVRLCYKYDALKKKIYRKRQPYKLRPETILRFLNDQLDMPIDCETYRLLYVHIAMWQPENRMSYVFQQRYRENENINFIFTQVTSQLLRGLIRKFSISYNMYIDFFAS